jgi:hypothetical protein
VVTSGCISIFLITLLGDVYVSVTLDMYGTKLSTFLFQQYKNMDSYVEINEFSEIPKNKHLLDIKKCFFEKSNEQETIDERCDIAIRFVFQQTFFTGLSIVINDRAGSAPAEAYIYYNSEESVRSGNTIVIPWIGVQITLTHPPYLIDLIAITLATIGVMYILKTGIRKRNGLQKSHSRSWLFKIASLFFNLPSCQIIFIFFFKPAEHDSS